MSKPEKRTDGPASAETKFRATDTSARRPIEMIGELTEYDRPQRLPCRGIPRVTELVSAYSRAATPLRAKGEAS